MIILRKLFSSSNKKKKNEGEETEYQKGIRKRGATAIGSAVGIPIATAGSLISTAIVENKYKKGDKKIKELYNKHDKRIDDEYEAIKNKINEKSEEVKKAIDKKYAPSEKDTSFEKVNKKVGRFNSNINRINVETELHNKNIARTSQKHQNLINAKSRLSDRLIKKSGKAQLLGTLGSIAVGAGLGTIVGKRVSKVKKEKNEKYNREKKK